MMKQKKIAAALLALVLLLSLTACGKSASQSAAYRPSAGNSSAAYDGGYFYEPEAPMPAPAEAMEASALGGFSAAAADKDEGAAQQNAPSAGDIAVDKIIYSAGVTVETTDFDDTLKKLDALVAQYGGFVESSSISGNNYYHSSHGYASSRSADYRIRIPSRDFAAVMNSLSTLGNVPYSNTYTENITSQYYDVQARLNAARTQEQTLLEMMAKADKVSDMLEIQDQLSDVRYRIESLESKLTNWDRQVSYSTISLSVQEVQIYTPEAKMSFGEQLRLALGRGLRGIGEFFRDLLLWLIEALPALLILGAFVVLAVFLVRRIRRASKSSMSSSTVSFTQLNFPIPPASFRK